MHSFNRRAALAGMSALFLAACTKPSPAPKFSEITFTHLPPLRLNAASLEIVEAYKSPFAAPNIEHLMPVSPASAARRWAQDRLVPVGGAGKIVFTITDARVIEANLPRTTGVRGVVTRDRSERYDATLKVRINVDSGDGRRQGEVSADAMRSRTVLEGLSLNEREDVWFKMTEELAGDINGELETAIRQFLQSFLVSGA